MASIDKDVHLTVEFLTFLRAGCFGQIIFQQSLERLKGPALTPGYLDIAHKTFDKLDNWLKDASQGLPIFSTSWETPETFDAISAFGFMKELKKELRNIIPAVEQALQIPDLSQQRDSVKLLAAAIMRSAAVRSAYVETLSDLYRQLRAQDLAQSVAFELPGAQEYVQVAQSIVETFSSDATYDVDLCERLRAEASLTPCDFKAHLHDATILLNVFNKEFTFEAAEIPRDIAQDWIEAKIPAVATGYWLAYNFTPADFQAWQEVQISGAPLAANWRRAGFEPPDAVKWMAEGLPPGLARVWRNAGFEATRAGSLIRRGITDPAKAPTDEIRSTDDEQESDQF